MLSDEADKKAIVDVKEGSSTEKISRDEQGHRLCLTELCAGVGQEIQRLKQLRLSHASFLPESNVSHAISSLPSKAGVPLQNKTRLPITGYNELSSLYDPVLLQRFNLDEWTAAVQPSCIGEATNLVDGTTPGKEAAFEADAR